MPNYKHVLCTVVNVQLCNLVRSHGIGTLASQLWHRQAKLLAKLRMYDVHMPFQVALAECLDFCHQNAYFELQANKCSLCCK